MREGRGAIVSPSASYRNTFANGDSARRYDEVVYAAGSSAEILSRVEARWIRALAAACLAGRAGSAYLDFACGTGRILALIADLAASATGIDVSPAMLERAAGRNTKARLLRKDITAPDDQAEAQYDLITAFRFLTNAEPALRSAVLRRLHARLKDDGLLLINSHGNPWSYRLALLPYHWARDRAAGRPLFGYLSRRATRRLLAQAGFRVERMIGMGFVPEKLLAFIPKALASRIENAAAGTPLLQAVGLNQLFVCRKARAG